MALVGDLGSEFWGPGPVDPNEQKWPSVDAIKAIMPKSPLPPPDEKARRGMHISVVEAPWTPGLTLAVSTRSDTVFSE